MKARIWSVAVPLGAIALIAAACATPAGLSVGEQAPAFSLPDLAGQEVSISDYRGNQPVLLYFHMAVG